MSCEKICLPITRRGCKCAMSNEEIIRLVNTKAGVKSLVEKLPVTKASINSLLIAHSRSGSMKSAESEVALKEVMPQSSETTLNEPLV